MSISPPAAVLLLSIEERHVERIFAGEKQFELRKVLPREDFERVYLYQTGGDGVVGCFDVGSIITDTPEKVWERVGNSATTQDRFFRYFGNYKKANAVQIKNPIRFSNQYSSANIRALAGTFSPPRSFNRYLEGETIYRFFELVREIESDRHDCGVTLAPILESEKVDYKKLVSHHIGAYYDEIDSSFAESILRTHDFGIDPIGFFTQRKEVLRILDQNDRLLGFTTLTTKGGGSVKTGPTILLEQFRVNGLAKKLAVHWNCGRWYWEQERYIAPVPQLPQKR